jgi:hypothetical protein
MAKVRNPLPMTVAWTKPKRRELYLDYQVKLNNWTVGVEVGVRHGRVLFHLLDNNPYLKMYAVDCDITQFYNKAVQSRYGSRLTVLAGESSEQAVHITEPLDFCFIDASHSTKGVVRDLQAYSPLLKTKRGMIGHDSDFPAVQQALAICGVEFEVGPDNVWHQKN